MSPSPSGRIRIADERATIAVNPDRSFLAGWVSVEAPERISWSIEVEGLGTTIDAPEGETADEAEERLRLARFLSHEGCNAEIRGLIFPLSNWRELDGVSTSLGFRDAGMHPILPDNPANFYYATEHAVPENTRIAIGPRHGHLFRVLWRFRPERYAGEDGGEAELDAVLPLREIYVYFPDGQLPDEHLAKACASRFAEAGDLGTVTVDRNWVHFAINVHVL